MIKFNHNQIIWAKKVLLKGELGSDEKEELKKIYQDKIDKGYDPCAGCHMIVRENFRRLVALMCESENITDLIYYRKK